MWFDPGLAGLFITSTLIHLGEDINLLFVSLHDQPDHQLGTPMLDNFLPYLRCNHGHCMQNVNSCCI